MDLERIPLKRLRKRLYPSILQRDTIQPALARSLGLGTKHSQCLGLDRPRPSGFVSISGRSYTDTHKLRLMFDRRHLYLTLKVHIRGRKILPQVAIVERLRENWNDHPRKKFVQLINDSFEITGPMASSLVSSIPPALTRATARNAFQREG